MIVGVGANSAALSSVTYAAVAVTAVAETDAEGGYRGYTTLSAPKEGKWRCSVETASGALIGRVGFRVVKAATTTLSTVRL